MSIGMSQIIPVTIIDDFFENPDDVVNFANSLSYETDPEYKWPGKRSNFLHLENQDFYNAFCYKFFSLFFDVETDKNFRWESFLSFQKIDSWYESGWTHSDIPSLITVIVYLNKNNNPNSGTTIMSKNTLCVNTEKQSKAKYDFFTTKKNNSEIEQVKIDNEKQFNESITIQNKYNRLIAFESHLWHKAKDYNLQTEDERLTLIMFVDKLYASKLPIRNMRNFII